MNATMTKNQIQARIAELLATADAMVGTDEGTHSKPAYHYVYETITGSRYGVRRAGSHSSTITEAEADERTDGRIRHLAANESDIRAVAREIKELRKTLTSAK